MKCPPQQQFNELYQFAHQLASKQIIGSRSKCCLVMKNEFTKDLKKLNQICQKYRIGLSLKLNLPPASEWLVDNMYLINEQAQFIKKNFPWNYCSKLPTIIDGPMKGHKRIYVIILELLDRTDGRCDPELLKEFLWEYQTVKPLTIGELWAVPIVFRMAIIHKLRILFETVNQDILPDKQANILLKQIAPLLKNISNKVHHIVQVIEKHLDLSNPAVMVNLAKHFREAVESDSLNRWLEARTATQNLTLSGLLEEENRRQSESRVSAGQLISSLRQISQTIWERHFEELSLVELTLRRDPAGIYPKMDFASRDILRHTLEKLAQRWRLSELIIAEQILKIAENASGTPEELEVKKHVGYYLIDEGRHQVPGALGIHSNAYTHFRERLVNCPNVVYFSCLALFAGFFIYAMIQYLLQINLERFGWVLLTLALPLTVLAGEWAIRQLHYLITIIFPPQRLLKMDFQKGVPAECRTLVVIPTMLTSTESVEKLAHKLEIYHLANQDPHIHFALLTDFVDAENETLPGEEELIQKAITTINELNQKYPHPQNTYFFLFHRKRLWNPCERKWMGWERKRGKLAEFNALLCGEKDTTFSHIVGDASVFQNIRYVITLDTDTQLQRETAKRLIGTLAHPLNRPILDPERKKVIRGYGLLQPRIAISHVSTSRSFYARIFGGQSGIDVYSGAVSDPYQDLFQRGIFTGKGIYDVRVFHSILGDRIPDNMVLSHDLLEGSFIKAGLVTDIELVDDYPSTYLNALERMHRWVRGDWQLLPWLISKVENRHGVKTDVELDLVCRWQIIDNLRRSLLGPSILMLIGAGLVVLNQAPIPKWPLSLIITVTLFHFLKNIFYGIRTGAKLSHHIIRPLFSFIVLPHYVLRMIDAIIRTIYRLYISRRHLLEWVTAEEAGKRIPTCFGGIFRKMLTGTGFVLLFGGVLWTISSMTISSNNNLIIWFTVVWLSAPFWVYLISYERYIYKEKLTASEESYLRDVAWRTWKFFREAVTEADHGLPPDNLQVDPPNGLAHRTSPTNIGLYLCSVITARDFGYIGTLEMLERIRCTVDTITSLPRWNGHLYNWYDTVSLEPLQPLYVSTVDSGNLVGYLFAVKQGIKECLESPLLNSQLLVGLLDMVRWEQQHYQRDLKHLEHQLEESLKNPPVTWQGWYDLLYSMQEGAYQSKETVAAIKARLMELEALLPWLKKGSEYLPAVAPAVAGSEGEPISETAVCSLAELFLIMDGQESLAVEAKNSQKALNKSNHQFGEALNKVKGIIREVDNLVSALDQLAMEHDFSVLYNEEHRLFAIGYNVTNKQLDKSFYDLFASEMRQTSFVAIAMGQIPLEHWFALKRTMTKVSGTPTLVSWSGTMFEYFMPLLLLPNYPDTLWDITYQMVVRKQIKYAESKGIPWGISESGYSLQDFNLNYQYQAFGIPGLGLKQGLEKDLVVSPYSTVLAALQEPQLAIKNLKRLEKYDAYGKLGFFEAIDFTKERLSPKCQFTVVKSHMAHHQGMIFNAIANILFENCWHKRFLSEPRIEATEPILRERVPNRGLLLSYKPLNLIVLHTLNEQTVDLRSFYQADTLLPEARLLSNGNYTVMISNSGSGFARWKQMDITRWVEDPVKDVSGPFYYIRDMNQDKVWSPAFHPCRVETDDMKMEYSLGRVTFSRMDGNIQTTMDVTVAPDIDAEVRVLTMTNHSECSCVLEVTSFLELALAAHEQFQAHPAFSKLFIETEFVPGLDLLLAHRHQDGNGSGPYVAYMMNVDGHSIGTLEYETDRSRFIGRGRSASIPQVVQTGHHLSGFVGSVLDPIFSMRRRINLPARRTVHVFCITAIAETRDEVLEICRKLRYPFQVHRAFDLALAKKQLELKDLNISPREANIFQWMASQLIYFNNYREQRTQTLNRNTKGQSGLWAYGISGDFPIVCIDFDINSDFDLAEIMFKAQKYWLINGLIIDLVFIAQESDGYNQTTVEGLRKLINTYINSEFFKVLNSHIFILAKNKLQEADWILLKTVSRLQLAADQGTLVSQLQPVTEANSLILSDFPVQLPLANIYNVTVSIPPEELIFFNGWGGFTPSGKEYVIYLKAKDLPPQPWINVIANPNFGFLMSETGGGYTWAENSREFKITPWSNDPVLDPLGEIGYLRDEDTGLLWTVTPMPIRDSEPYTIRHGQGYSSISHSSQGIICNADFWTPLDDPVKIIELTLKNTDVKPRKLSVTYYLEWVLGTNREQTYSHIVTEIDNISGAILARNAYQDYFPDRYGFLNIWTEHPVYERSWTGNRNEFIGRNGSLRQPAGLGKVSLDNKTGANFNPCGAIQIKIKLNPDEQTKVYILVGAAKNRISAQQYLLQYQQHEIIASSRKEVADFWQNLLSQVEVTTPDVGFNFLMNHWLIYQTLSCRIWARSAFYQSGGAFGYRDQLQDVIALLHTRPDLTRSQILLHAAHQFQEGDVQHWWHNETRHGIRTRYSDDLLWLVYVTCRYVNHTGDDSIWEEEIPFLVERTLRPDEKEYYSETKISEEKASIYDHCNRAIDRAAVFGVHSLPLMGGGDWNDGMNKIGIEGRGESVWLAWFLHRVLLDFIPVCQRRGDQERVEKYRFIMDQIAWASENTAWDGQWYRRAYNDNGDPIGSVNNSECQIDCIAQAWAVISEVASLDKSYTAMRSLYHKLVLHDEAVINLLSPPFSQTDPSPGYIQMYPPGVRENGGQYTHGAVWAVIALAKLGEGNLAYELFRMLNPIYHTQTPHEVQTYRVEPYVMAADVYSTPPYTGRGGWSWYTGSAGWMYQAGLEWILGINRQGDYLQIKPSIPEDWPECRVIYRFEQSVYDILIKNPERKQTGLQSLSLDGKMLDPQSGQILLVNDEKTHYVEVVL